MLLLGDQSYYNIIVSHTMIGGMQYFSMYSGRIKKTVQGKYYLYIPTYVEQYNIIMSSLIYGLCFLYVCGCLLRNARVGDRKKYNNIQVTGGL